MRDKINIALVGFGYWGKNLARVIDEHPNCNLAYIVDVNPRALAKAKKLYENSNCGIEVEECFLDEKITVVVIATPVSTHEFLINEALEYNKHVLCEKVITPNTTLLINLFEKASQKSRILKEGHTFLYNSVVNYIKEAIHLGQLGKLYYLTFKRTGLGPYRQDVDVLYDLAPHDISILQHWFGLPKWVMANSRSLVKSNVADVVFVQLGYEEGLLVQLQLSWINPMKQRVVEVVGEKCMMIFDDVNTTEKLRIINTGVDYNKQITDFGSFQLSVKDGDIIIPNIKYQEPLKQEFDTFIHQVVGHKILETDKTTSVNVVTTLSAIADSMKKNGERVYVN